MECGALVYNPHSKTIDGNNISIDFNRYAKDACKCTGEIDGDVKPSVKDRIGQVRRQHRRYSDGADKEYYKKSPWVQGFCC